MKIKKMACYTKNIMTKKSSTRSLRVNMISESEFTVQGHGVHTAYKEITEALKKRKDIDIKVNTNRPADIVHVQTIGMYALGRLLRRNGKKVVSAHLVPDSLVGSIRAAKYWRGLAKLWMKFFYGRADLVLACSGMVRDELKNKMKLKNVDLLYNTVDMAQYRISPKEKAEARKELGLSAKDFVVVGNGQVQPRKRLDTFLAIAKAMPDAKFFWVGGIPFKHLGAEYESMNRLIKKLPENVEVTGVIPLAEVRKYYAVADVFTLPATQENHPMCVLEAAGASLPVVLRDIPEYDDTFRGDALMAKNDQEFIDIIRRLKDDKKYYDRAVDGAKKIAKRFDSVAGAERVVEFYNSLLSN